MKIGEMSQTAANGSENVADGVARSQGGDDHTAMVADCLTTVRQIFGTDYPEWADASEKERRTGKNFLTTASIKALLDIEWKAHGLPPAWTEAVLKAGFIKPASGRIQTRETGAAGAAGAALAGGKEQKGYYAPPLRTAERDAELRRGTVSDVPAFVDLGEDGQPLVREVGELVGTDSTVAIELNFGAEVETAEATTAPPETPTAVEFPEFGSVEYNRMVDIVVNLAKVPKPSKPSHLVGYSSALAEASAKVRSLGAPETLVAAVSYAAMGWRVLPWVAGYYIKGEGRKQTFIALRDDGDTAPVGTEIIKKPMIKAWQENATTNQAQHIGWFDDGEFFGKACDGYFRGANIGIATGETADGYDLVVLDVDVKGGKDGGKALAGLAGELGSLPATLMASTPSGGLHYLFKAPMGSDIGSDKGVFKQHGDGLDIRGRGGYIGAAPSVMPGGGVYQWLNDLLPAWLPDSWIMALQAECPVGGKRGAVSNGSSNGDGERVTRGKLLPMPEDVAVAIAEHAVPSDVERTGWLKVLSVLSGFAGGEALARHWSGTGNYAERFNDADFDKAWDEVHGGFNGGVPMGVGALFNMVNEHSPEWKTPAARRKLEQEAKEQAVREAARDAVYGVMPDWMKGSLPQRTNVSMPIAAVSDDRAREVLNDFIAKGNDVAKRVQAGENVGHDAEYLFIAGMLTMNADAVKYQVEHNPIPQNRSSKYHTSKGKVRAVIMHKDGSKPATAGDVNMDLFTPDWVKGTYEMAMRIANRLMLDRDVTQGVEPTETEKALVKRVIELSPLGLWFLERKQGGDNLTSAVEGGLGGAKRYSTNTPKPSGKGPGSGLATGELPKTGVRLSWIDKELTHHGGAVGELLDTPTSDQIESLLGVYGCRAVFDEMRGKVAVHGLPKRFAKLDDIVTAIRELATRHGTEWRKADVTDFLKLLANGTGYHPALEWVRRIPWDGVDRFGALLATVEPEEDYGGLWRIGLHRWCMGAARCLVQPEGMRGVPTIVFYAPAGGEGKDMWQSSLCPLEYQARPNGFDPGNLNWMLAALNGWLGIFPEITTQSRKADIEHVKAFLTADKDSYTSKYEMDVNDRLRRTVYLASTNESDYLADRTGTNRRFITIAVKSIDYRHRIDMQQFWAQMLHKFEAAWAVNDEHVHRYWLEGEESQVLAEVNENHKVADLLEDQIKELWDFEDEAWQRDKRRTDWAVSVQAVAKRLDPDSAMNTSNIPQMFMKRIAREMSALGVIRKQMRGKDGKTNYYLMPPSKPMKPTYTVHAK